MTREVLPKWFAVADARQAKLFTIERTAAGRWHVDLRGSLANTWLAVHEHHRPDSLGKGPMANAAQRFASLGHEQEELSRRFARDICGWLSQAIHDHQIDRLRIFAPPGSLSLLRGELAQIGAALSFVECELATFAPSELAIHPVVLRSVQTVG